MNPNQQTNACMRPWGDDPRTVALREAGVLLRKQAGKIRAASGKTVPAGEAMRRSRELVNLARKIEKL